MAPSLWDPYKTLDIIPRNRGKMTCVGTTRFGHRCRWDIAHSKVQQVVAILDEMALKPPDETCQKGADYLPRLALLSLCEEYHRKMYEQRTQVTEEWEGAIMDAAEEYEKVEKVKRRNRELRSQLRQEVSSIEKRVEMDDQERAGFTAKVEELSSQLAVAVADSMAHKNSSAEARDTNWGLTKRVFELQGMLDVSKAEEARLRTVWVEREAEVTRQRAEERQALESNQKDAESKTLKQSKVIEGLQSRLEQECQLSEKHGTELGEAVAKHAALAAQAQELELELHQQRQASELGKEDLEKAMTDRTALLAQAETLQSQFAAEHQSAKVFKESLTETEKKRSLLSTELNALQSQLASERQINKVLTRELDATTKELTTARKTQERTELALEQSMRTNQEEQAAAAARDLAASAENTQLRERVQELERKSPAGFLRRFRGAVDRFVKRVVHGMG